MKRVLSIIIGIVLVVGGFFFIKSNIIHKELNNDNYKENSFLENQDKENYFNDVRFDKGYDGIAAVEGATNCKYITDIDGDTLKVNVKGKEDTVRFFGIDSAEDVNPKIKV
ncbi:hypothetical protein ACV3R5_14950 [Clostridium perfringens]|uniref:hypothetical protein n=1 Tax=Clostridium perfringens TaxID=1502 RepID=UPI0039EB09BC